MYILSVLEYSANKLAKIVGKKAEELIKLMGKIKGEVIDTESVCIG